MKQAYGRSAAVSLVIISLFFFSAACAAESETETQTQSQTFTRTGGGGQTLQFALVPQPVQGAPNYVEGNGSVDIQIQGTQASIHAQINEGARGARFSLSLTINGTSHPVANMTSNDDGEIEAEAAISLAPGTYSIGVRVYDTSTFGTPTLVLTSNPSTRVASISGSSSTTYSQPGQQTQSVSTFRGGETEDDNIRNAIHSMFIPAVIDVGGSGPSVNVTDSRFSVSVGSYQQSGLLISISASNVTGPRVLLVNLSSSASQDILTGQLVVSLDGIQVQQGSSFAQVMGAQAADPSRFVVTTAASGVEFLISIPHFSYHVIEILPIVSQVVSALSVDVPLLLVSAAVVTVVFVAAYDRRTRIAG